jgi:uncharacterized membrane protein YgcG
MRLHNKNCGGFSLLEVAMILVAIGLLTGAALGGQQLITTVQAGRTVAQAQEVAAAHLAYLDRYRSLAGDDPRASERWSQAIDGNGDGVLSGRFDDAAPGDLTALTVDANGGENLNFWWHLRLAGLINGATEDAAAASPPAHPFGGIGGLQQGAYGMRAIALCMDNVPGTIAAAIDRRADDERPGSGAVRAAPSTGGLPPAAYPTTDELYTLCVAVGGSGSGAVAALVPAASAGDAAEPGGSDAPSGDAGAADPGVADAGTGDAGAGGSGSGDSGDWGGGGWGGGGWDGGSWGGGSGGWGGGGHH